MAAASDKARFYLEQIVPELREWERREIFSKSEITSISSKRSHFEHTINARGPTSGDYAKYIEYEMNLDALRRKRVKRLGAKATAHTGQKRIFSILDRATKKFHGDVGLWMQYVEYCRRQHANQRLSRVLTDVLRLHPTKPELWIYAARYAMDVQADVDAMRSAMQRGLRFCKGSKALYLEYARLEMRYIAKIAARRRILGLDKNESVTDIVTEQHEANDVLNADTIALPSVSAAELEGEDDPRHLVDDSTLQKFTNTPALKGAIPSTIFDAAMKQFPKDGRLGRQFFDMFAEFFPLSCVGSILRHVIDVLASSEDTVLEGLSCRCKLHIVESSPESVEFPAAVRTCLQDIRTVLSDQTPNDKEMLADLLLGWLQPLVSEPKFGPELQQVLSATTQKLIRERDISNT